MKKLIAVLIIMFSLVSPGHALASERSEVEDYLNNLKLGGWMESYKYGIFDCSNMCSLLTIKLKDYETRIEEGWILKASSEVKSNETIVKFNKVRHAIVKIKLDNEWYIIETTNLTLHDKYNQFTAEIMFKDYKEAIQYHGNNGEREYGIGGRK